MQKRIDNLFKLWNENEGAGGQLLVTYKGETIFEKCYGYANIETGTPITPDTVFHVASVTKQITVMSVMILQERGLLNVEDDVREYIPDLRSSRPVGASPAQRQKDGRCPCSDRYSRCHLPPDRPQF